MVRAAAWRGPRAAEARQDVTPLAESMTGQVIRERRQHHIPDLGAVPNLSPTLRDRVNRHGSASLLYAPMLQKNIGLGSIVVVRWPPRPFSGREQALLKTFADQAVIAVQNARLFNETQEALQQQTATSDILRVIASSPGDLQPVLDRLAETTCRLCGANDALIFLRDGGDLRLDAHYGPIPTPPSFVTRPIGRDWVVGRAVADCESIHVHDLAAAADEYPVGILLSKETAGAGTPGLAWRTTLAMPLMREGEAVGAISLRRVEVSPFTDAQIALLRTFADQAVIAIENARLFDEVQARTRDLTESLEQQTAAGEILRVISSSPTDVQPVFDAIAHSAAGLCEATNGTVFRLRDGLVHLVGHYSLSQEQLASVQRSFPAPLDRGTASGRAILSRRRPYPRHRRRPGILGPVVSQDGSSQCALGTDVAQRRIDRLHQCQPRGVAPVFRPPDRTPEDVRRSGRHRHQQCRPLQRDPGGVGAANRDSRDPARHQPVADRRAARVRTNRRNRQPRAPLRNGGRTALRGRRLPHRGRDDNGGPGCRCRAHARVHRSQRQFSLSRDRAEESGVSARLVAHRAAGTRTQSASKVGNQLGALSAAAARKRMHRGARAGEQDRQCLRSRGNCSGRILSRSGGDRDRERATVRRGAGADARSHRGAAAADRHRRRP